MKLISKFIFWLLGWKLDKGLNPNIKKCVLIQAPHTSNWDFVIGKLASYQYNLKPKIFIKDSLFFFPLGSLLRTLGGLPVNRKTNNNTVQEIAYQLSVQDDLMVLLTPEGTRSHNPKWKKGFYYISKTSRAPIYLVHIDYAKKEIGFSKEFELSNNVDADIEKLKEYFKQFTGKNPENGVR